jgi:hypothetical protein
MARNHFAQFMTSPQFNHACDENCKVTKHHKKNSIIKKILKKVGKK